MSERLQLDPLVNRRVILKLYGEPPMHATLVGYDDTGYWLKGGTLAEHLKTAVSGGTDDVVQFLELTRIEWFQEAPDNGK
jgi:hypothetical protein